ncbi:MAG: rod shape-determining protein MreC [Hyphomicrobiales bacterium]
MRNILLFFIRFRFFFFFVILEIVAFAFFVNFNKYQNSVATNTAAEVSGSVNGVITNATDYLDLKSVNDILSLENAKLRTENSLFEKAINDTLPIAKKDTIYKYIAAKVSNISVNKQYNYMIIDKGLNDSITTDMGVISSNGIVGVIVGVSKNYSTVMLAIHRNSLISARIKKNNQLAAIEWQGNDYRVGVLKDIPFHIQLSKGDTIITSGNSFVFPPDINIGVVKDYKIETGEKLNRADIEFSTDFNSLQHVYIVQNRGKEEQESLLDQTVNK